MRQATENIEREMTLLARYRYMAMAQTTQLDRSAYILLCRIELDGPLSIGQLVDALDLDTSTLNRQTAAMTRAGLVERIPDPEGGLARKFRMTDEGARKLAADREDAVNNLQRVLADWTPEEAADFAAALERFNSSIETIIGQPWPRP
ncbi:MarR family transcriptional regulator [Streptomyces sp. NBC_01387]|uniref:MarR family winged helix-turn-helix transcriptional regulator n=2 Tax=Streptomyces TaxID=1883 RepID=UPI0020249098|nr:MULTISPECIES: MarR family transcriptional regulator [unclassified Streptomyces]MCX4550117.1 MarR family transcriptional regulator [Streptomyces sp. NBC_01500]WSC21614.1 MarR family transcriptional regulator [Streptomyces sp. NBC_01766]WSV55575.1 MarR family transcriptional regulator [Streptomyces sp. NBC_01014]